LYGSVIHICFLKCRHALKLSKVNGLNWIYFVLYLASNVLSLGIFVGSNSTYDVRVVIASFGALSGCVVIKFVIFVVSFYSQFPAFIYFFCGNVHLPCWDVIKKIIAILDILFASFSFFISWKLNEGQKGAAGVVLPLLVTLKVQQAKTRKQQQLQQQ